MRLPPRGIGQRRSATRAPRWCHTAWAGALAGAGPTVMLEAQSGKLPLARGGSRDCSRQWRGGAVWKATHNELLVPYFFAKAFGLTISFTVTPTQKGQGDFQIIHPKGRVIVEVKTPRGDDPNLEGPQGGVHWGWDEELIKPVFLEAAGRLRRGNLNLVVICTHLCAWIHDSMPFERMLYGEDTIAATFDPETGNVGEPRTEFRPNGELLRHKPKRYTRISAVASLRTDAYFTEEERNQACWKETVLNPPVHDRRMGTRHHGIPASLDVYVLQMGQTAPLQGQDTSNCGGYAVESTRRL